MKKLLAAVIVLAVSTARADTIFVDDDAPLGGDGLSWNTAYAFLQDALANAGPGTEIRVAQGRYLPDQNEAGSATPGDRSATFQLLNEVSLMGGFGGLAAADPDARDIELYETVLSGDLLVDDGPGFANNDENSFHVVTGSGTVGTALLDGFTIRGGNADGEVSQQGCHDRCGGGLFNDGGSPTLVDCTFEACRALALAGAVYNSGPGSPTFINCTFTGNDTNAGGAMYNRASSTPTITGCVFVDNTALIAAAMVNINTSATISESVFERNTASGSPGALYELVASSTLTDCIFRDNSASSAGAAWCFGGTSFIGCLFSGNSSTSPNGFGGGALFGCDVFVDCTFVGNTSATVGGAIAGHAASTLTGCLFMGNSASDSGGAIFQEGVDPTIIACRFEDNSAARGGAIAGRDTAAMIFGCQFSGNTAAGDGGAIDYVDSDPDVIDSPVIVNTTFSVNSAGGFGGAVSNFATDATVINCTFGGNTAGNGGGLFSTVFSSAIVTNCTFSDNSASGTGGAILSGLASDATVSNCIFWNNGPDAISGPATAVYSDVEGGFLGIGNIDADPLFVDPDNGDYRLQPGSPCVDAADNTAVPQDIATDLDGNPRFLEIPETPDTGNGTLPIVDMGAYESLGGGCLAVTSQVVECHADGTTFTVNIEGLNACTGGTTQFTFTASGGAVGEELCFTALVNDGGFCCTTEICVTIPDCTPAGLPSDLDGDMLDLLLLLGNWGP